MSRWDLNHDDGVAHYDQAVDEAEEEVIRMGLHVSTIPTGPHGEEEIRPTVPMNLSECTLPFLQDLIGQFTAWYDYALGQLQLAVARRNAADKKRAYSWSRIRKTKDGRVADKDDDTRCDSRYVGQDKHYEFCDAKVRILSGVVDGLKRDIETISRSITALEGRQDVEGRAAGIQRRRQEKASGGRSDLFMRQFRKRR